MNSIIHISSVNGNSQWLDGGSMFGNVPRALWSRWVDVDENHRIHLACRCLLIESGSRKILCETGIGNFFEPKLADRFGVHEAHNVVVSSLSDLGIAPEEIDTIILSHLHFDHAGGLLPSYAEMAAGANGLVFPNARIAVGKQAWERANAPHSRDKASFLPELHKRLLADDRLMIVDGDSHPELLPEHISFLYSQGHTPGQMHTVVRGATETVVFAGDLIPGTPWVHLPVTMGYDRYPEMLIDEKRDLYNAAVDKAWWLFYTHDSKYCASKVIKNQSSRFEPANETSVFVRKAI